MIPKHQELIDTTLRMVEERARVLQRALHPPAARVQGEEGEPEAPSHAAPSIESLRESLLGQHFRWLAEYVEGYPAAVEPQRQELPRWHATAPPVLTGGMRKVVYQVCAVVYGSVFGGNTWAFPKQSQHTDLGRLLHAALLQFYRQYLPSDQLVSVAQAAAEIDVGRQTLHGWCC